MYKKLLKTCRSEAALRSWDSHLVLQIAWFQDIDVYNIMISVCLFRGRLNIGATRNRYFWSDFWGDIGKTFHIPGRLSAPHQYFPLKKLGTQADAHGKYWFVSRTETRSQTSDCSFSPLKRSCALRFRERLDWESKFCSCMPLAITDSVL